MENHFLKSNSILKFIKIITFIIIGLTILGAKTNPIISQTEIIQISETLRSNELELRNLEIYKNLLQAQEKQRKEQLYFYKKEISNNIVSLYKLNIASLKLLLYSEQSKQDALISYSILTYYTEYIKEEITKIREYIILIQKNNIESKKIEQKILKNNQEIKKNIEIIKNYAKINNYSSEEIQKLKYYNENLIKDSKNLSNLIKEINKKHYIKSELETDNKIIKEKGNFVWPNAGFLETSFKTSKNQLYKNGIIIVTLPNSQIIAPFDGEILFVDSFENFNTIIIIKHSSSIYSIISGEIMPLVNQLQLVKKHEPVALSSKNVSTIYFEIKYKDESSDPLIWLQKREKE